MRFREAIGTILAEISGVLDEVNQSDVTGLLRRLRSAKRIFVAGEGRSGMAARAFAMRIMHLGREVYIAGDPVSPRIGRGDLLVVVSGSGETARTLATARTGKAAGAKLVAISATPRSSIARLAHARIILPQATRPTPRAGKKSAQPLDSLFDQAAYLFLDAIIMILRTELGRTQQEMRARHAQL